jgi:hypothetical protein
MVPELVTEQGIPDRDVGVGHEQGPATQLPLARVERRADDHVNRVRSTVLEDAERQPVGPRQPLARASVREGGGAEEGVEIVADAAEPGQVPVDQLVAGDRRNGIHVSVPPRRQVRRDHSRRASEIELDAGGAEHLVRDRRRPLHALVEIRWGRFAGVPHEHRLEGDESLQPDDDRVRAIVRRRRGLGLLTAGGGQPRHQHHDINASPRLASPRLAIGEQYPRSSTHTTSIHMWCEHFDAPTPSTETPVPAPCPPGVRAPRMSTERRRRAPAPDRVKPLRLPAT